MKILLSSSDNPYFNIATEELLLKNYNHDFIFLYINKPSLIIGKHQNAMGELNPDFVYQNKLPVVRRLSGGGAVYHDEGNLNFCFIQNGEKGKLVDFKKFTQPIIDFLATKGCEVERNERNNLIIKGRKISGNAEHLFKQRVLHHGTLLFKSKLDNLDEAIRVELKSFEDKSVKSVRSEVVNISEFTTATYGMSEFTNDLFTHMKEAFEASLFEFNAEDRLFIERLIHEKYATWDWNYAYSPVYKKRIDVSVNGIKEKLIFEVKKGEILSVSFENEDFNTSVSFEELIGQKHSPAFMCERLPEFLEQKNIQIV